MALTPAWIKFDRISHPIWRSRQVECVVLFSIAAMIALMLTAQLAVVIEAGRWVDVGWVDLNATGGLLVGSVQGLLQYAVLRSRYRVSPVWIAVTAIGWAMAAGYGWQHLDVFPLLVQGLCSPMIFGLVGLAQCLFLFHQRKLAIGWAKMVGWQIGWVVLLKLMTLLLTFGLAILTLATLGKGGVTLSILHTSAIGIYNGGLLAHGVMPAVELYRLCHDERLNSSATPLLERFEGCITSKSRE